MRSKEGWGLGVTVLKNIWVNIHISSTQCINLSFTSVSFLSFFLFCGLIMTFLIPRHSIKWKPGMSVHCDYFLKIFLFWWWVDLLKFQLPCGDIHDNMVLQAIATFSFPYVLVLPDCHSHVWRVLSSGCWNDGVDAETLSFLATVMSDLHSCSLPPGTRDKQLILLALLFLWADVHSWDHQVEVILWTLTT